MDVVIIKGDFNARYGNTTTCISFSIQDTVINAIIEVSAWSIIVTFLLSGKPLILSATLFDRCRYNVSSNKGRESEFIQVTLSNRPGERG